MELCVMELWLHWQFSNGSTSLELSSVISRPVPCVSVFLKTSAFSVAAWSCSITVTHHVAPGGNLHNFLSSDWAAKSFSSNCSYVVCNKSCMTGDKSAFLRACRNLPQRQNWSAMNRKWWQCRFQISALKWKVAVHAHLGIFLPYLNVETGVIS